MKAKENILEWFAIVLVMVIDVYLLNNVIRVNRYETHKDIGSTANYIEIETKEDEQSEILAGSVILYQEEIEKQNESINKDNTLEDNNNELDPIVYEGKTLDELSELLNKSLNSTISGKGYLIASYSLEKNVDPVMATAIILHETGCKWGCSSLVINCNNVGGQKGQGCGSYSYFNTLDEGIMRFIDNLSNNYINYGLTTPETINPKYAEDPNWARNVNKYIENIKAQ